MIVSVMLVSHNKPQLVKKAIVSILAQTYPYWQAVVVDSGILWDQGFFQQFHDPRFLMLRSWETPEKLEGKAPAPYLFNSIVSGGLIQGQLLMYYCDDDILYPECFATFVHFFKKNPDVMAAYASQDLGIVRADGSCELVGRRLALHPAGSSCSGMPLDCVVDGLQVCHRVEVWEPWDESKDHETHSDGVWLESLGSKYPIMPIRDVLTCNRRTPLSTYQPSH